jgi:uncharacterized alpha-E superfamily protein
MLARDAENLYWMARYLERAENTARLIIKISDTLLDIPNGASLGWETLLKVAGLDDFYHKYYDDANENDIMYFLIQDERNPSSILSCVKYARENTRTLREMLPEDLWERINGLYLYIQHNLADAAVNRRNKYLFLQSIITQRQAIIGLIACAMEQDLAYHFIKLGRSVERADMTTRIMDINYAISLPEDHPLFEITMQTLWAGILKSLSAFQTYRRLKAFHVNMADVVDFLFQEKRFPRSVNHCLSEMEACLLSMPQSEKIMQTIKTAQMNISLHNTKTMNLSKLHEYIDLSQQYLGNIHQSIETVYFRADEAASEATQAQSAVAA